MVDCFCILIRSEDNPRVLSSLSATLLGIQKELGTIEVDKWASFTVYDQNPFLYQAKVLEVYSKGERKVYQTTAIADLRGTYSLNIDGTKFWLEIGGTYARTITSSAE